MEAYTDAAATLIWPVPVQRVPAEIVYIQVHYPVYFEHN